MTFWTRVCGTECETRCLDRAIRDRSAKRTRSGECSRWHLSINLDPRRGELWSARRAKSGADPTGPEGREDFTRESPLRLRGGTAGPGRTGRRSRMNSKERVLTAIRHEEPGRVPVDSWWSHEIKDRLTAHLGLRNEDEPQERLGSDIRCVYPRFAHFVLTSFFPVVVVSATWSTSPWRLMCDTTD